AAGSGDAGPRPWAVRVTACSGQLDAWGRMKYTDTLASGGRAHRHAAATASSAMQTAATYRRVRLAIVCYVSAPIIFANSRSVRTRTPSFWARSSFDPGSPPATSRSVFFDTVELIIAPWSLASASARLRGNFDKVPVNTICFPASGPLDLAGAGAEGRTPASSKRWI